jgi:opacity protein-like surface antigen
MTPNASAPSRATRTSILVFAALFVVAPASAQDPSFDPSYDDPPAISLRPFFLASGQNFTAKETFKAVFGRTVEPFWGGGAQVAFRNGLFVDVTVSRFKASGERAFRFEGQNFRLGIPLTVTETPVEASGGYRFYVSPRLVPYVGAGIGSYAYEETSDFSNGDENVKARHTGYLVTGGAEIRLGGWLGLTADVQYTRVPGILGDGGVSKDAGEDDLGGVAARFRVIVGR